MKKATGTHTCIPIRASEISKLEFRNFIRQEMADGHVEYSQIFSSSKIAETYADHTGTLIGDERAYNRQVSDALQRKYGGTTRNIPEQYKTIRFTTLL